MVIVSAIVKEMLRQYDRIDLDSKIDLDEAIHSLDVSDRERMAISLYRDGYSLPIIAQKMGVTTRSVRRWIETTTDLIAQKLEVTDETILCNVEKRLNRPLTEEEVLVCNFILKNYGWDTKISIYNFRMVEGKVIR